LVDGSAEQAAWIDPSVIRQITAESRDVDQQVGATDLPIGGLPQNS
jgi:hypothetical protein